jgi:membrane fusion protein, copper/silver efflux system
MIKLPMKYIRIAIYVLILVVAFMAGRRFDGIGGLKHTVSQHKISHYICPMHPRYISDHPGDCPSCGMRLVLGETDDDSQPEMEEDGAVSAPGTVLIDWAKQHRIGIQLAPVVKSTGARILRTPGRVVVDETRIYVINSTIEGWITSTRPLATGDFVKKGQVLASFYSPEFLSSIQALLFALNSADRVHVTGKETAVQRDQLAQFDINLQQYKDSLRNLGMGDAQIEEIIKSRKRIENVDVTSPADGFLITRKVSDGLRFNKGDELYRIADLSRVWILADVFEREEAYLHPGMRVKTILANQDATVEARVSDSLPQFDPVSRTLKVRLITDNPGFRLRPEMFVNLEIPVQYSRALAVPCDAILDSGVKKTVFVAAENDTFEPRVVQTGWRSEGQVEILSGLNEGDQVVVAGAFMVDSESKMKASVAGISSAAAKDPVCSMDVSEEKAKANGLISIYKNQTFYFCSDLCKKSFDKAPKHYLETSGRVLIPILN